MPNHPPITDLQITPESYQLLGNESEVVVELNASGTRDPNAKAVLKYQHSSSNPDVIIENPAGITTKARIKPIAGKTSFTVKVTDRGQLSNEKTKEFEIKAAVSAPSGKTIFGANNQGKSAQDEIAINKGLGNCKALRSKENVKGYTKISNSVKPFFDAGMIHFINVGWDTTGKKFVTQAEMPSYRAALDKICKDLSPYKELIYLIFENEPTNKGENYWDDNIENYNEQFRNGVEVCKANGIKCADGGTHVPYLKALATGSRVTDKAGVNVADVQKMIMAFRDIPSDYVNIHFNNVFGKADFDPNDLKIVVKYIFDITGKKVISNEFHTEGARPGIIKNIVNGIADAGILYAIFFSGNQFIAGKADSLTKQGSNELNELGLEFRNAIAAL